MCGMGGWCMGNRPPRRGQGYQPAKARSRKQRGGTRDRSIPSVCSPGRAEKDPAMSTPIILDCDPGIDDALAIAFAAGSPEIELAALTTVAGNVGLDKTTATALSARAL